MSSSGNFLLTLFTNDPALARAADAAGIDRIGLDLEYLGKGVRQAGLKTWISDHQESQLSSIRSAVTRGKLFVRTNPIHSGSQNEIDRLIAAGAEALMLPFFARVDEARIFIDAIAGRADVSLLVETAPAAMRLHEIVRLPGIHDIHIGLNDLHLSLKLSSHFELLASPLMSLLARIVRDAGLRFGFGGVGRLNDRRLPIPSDLVYAQYAIHGATSALVARVFTTSDGEEVDLSSEVARCRARLDHWVNCTPEERMVALAALRLEVAKRFPGA